MAVEDTSTLQVALKNTLELDKGTGSPSFTRATNKLAFDDTNTLVLCKSGVSTFPGARLVLNEVVDTIDFSTWAKSSNATLTSSQTDPDGGTNATQISITSNANNWLANSSSLSQLNDRKVASITFKSGESHVWWCLGVTGSGENRRGKVWFNASTGAIGTTTSVGGWTVESSEVSQHPSDSSWYTISVSVSCDYSLDTQAGILLRAVDSDGSEWGFTSVSGASLTIYQPQLELTSDLTDSTPSEHISVGSLSNPWHGAGSDGSKWFTTDKSGSSISDSTLKRLLVEPAATNQALWCRDATNAAWTKTNITAALDQTGIDNRANSSSKLTSSAANGTCLQTITLSAATRSTSFYVKRITGTGTIEITRNGGTNWTDITSSINSSTYTRVGIKATSVTNPSIGFRIVTSGDAIAFDYAQDEAGSVFTSPILTTTATATRNADQLSYQTTSNFSDTAGAIALKVERDDWTDAGGTIGNGTSTGLSLSSSNSGVQALDGTNTVNGPSGTPTGQEQLAIGWSGSTLKAASGGTIGTSGSYDGSFNLTTINIEAKGNLADLNIWTSALTDAQLQEASGATATIITIGQSTETNAAQAFSFVKVLTVSQATETNAAVSFNASKIFSIAESVETDIANSFDRFKNLSINQSSEIDTSQAVNVAKQLAISQTSESNIAQDFGTIRIYGLVQSSESNSANTFDFVKQLAIGQSSETDLANIFTSNAPVIITQVSESDVANPFSISKLLGVSQSSETDTATANSIQKSVAIVQGTETDSSTQFAISKLFSLPTATETDVATQFVSSSLILIDQANETNIATVIQESKSLAIVQTIESDSAAVLNMAKTLEVIQSAETNIAQPFSTSFAIDILTANESDSATTADFKKALQIVATIEADSANIMTSPAIPKAVIALGIASGIYNTPAIAEIYDKQITAKLN